MKGHRRSNNQPSLFNPCPVLRAAQDVTERVFSTGPADVTSCLNPDFWSILVWSKRLRVNTSGSLGFVLRRFHSVRHLGACTTDSATQRVQTLRCTVTVLIRTHTERSIHIKAERQSAVKQSGKKTHYMSPICCRL